MQSYVADSAENQKRRLADNKCSPFISAQSSKADLFNATVADCFFFLKKSPRGGEREISLHSRCPTNLPSQLWAAPLILPKKKNIKNKSFFPYSILSFTVSDRDGQKLASSYPVHLRTAESVGSHPFRPSLSNTSKTHR